MDFSKLTAYLDSLAEQRVPGCDLAVYQDHQLLFRHQAGWRDAEKTVPMRGDETFCLYSCTKVFTTCAAMQLIESGKIRLDDPVSKYLPAYGRLTVRDGDGARPARTVMTVRHLMSMQSGLNYDGESPALKAAIARHPDADTRTLMDAKALDPLEFDPGDNFLYSLSHDVLATVIEAASGQRFSDYLRQHIFTPLGLKTMCFVLPEDQKNRQCAQYFYHGETDEMELRPAEDNHYRFTPAYESGGAGLIGDVRDYILFADALACGGESADGKRILSPEMIQLWNANQLGPAARRSFDAWNRKGYSYALGVRTRLDLAVGGLGSLGEFGWDGAAGAWAMIDPALHLSAFYGMHVRNFGYAYDVIHPTLRNLIYEAVEKQ